MKYDYGQAIPDYDTPPRIIDLATRRCRQILFSWMYGDRCDLRILLASCYVQGMADAMDALQRSTTTTRKGKEPWISSDLQGC
jgi:hypothetical protein